MLHVRVQVEVVAVGQEGEELLDLFESRGDQELGVASVTLGAKY
jgi:hypothetical protein